MTNQTNAGILVENAGIVLLNNYFITLFERLNLLVDGNFRNRISQIQATQYLHFLSAGSEHSKEQMLSLNKVICGLPINDPVPNYLNISEENVGLLNSLLKAVISHWSAIGDSTENGFRGNWIARNGVLTAHEDKWELAVEKRAYDLLINQSPFSFSVIKYDWMPKPLHVNWAY